jgi:hypothetical protein
MADELSLPRLSPFLGRLTVVRVMSFDSGNGAVSGSVTSGMPAAQTEPTTNDAATDNAVVRIALDGSAPTPFFKPGEHDTRSTFGVLADDKSGTLWAAVGDAADEQNAIRRGGDAFRKRCRVGQRHLGHARMSFEHSARKGCRMKRKIQRWVVTTALSVAASLVVGSVFPSLRYARTT